MQPFSTISELNYVRLSSCIMGLCVIVVVAILCEHSPIVQLLIGRGADMSIADCDGTRPRDLLNSSLSIDTNSWLIQSVNRHCILAANVTLVITTVMMGAQILSTVHVSSLQRLRLPCNAPAPKSNAPSSCYKTSEGHWTRLSCQANCWYRLPLSPSRGHWLSCFIWSLRSQSLWYVSNWCLLTVVCINSVEKRISHFFAVV